MSISGLVDIGFQNARNEDKTTSTNKMAHNGSATTAVIIAGTEDLGGGMKANFRYEMNPDFVSGTGLSAATGANGYNFLGLAGSFGEIKLGRLNTPALSAFAAGSVFGTALGSGYGAGQNIYSAAAASAATTATQTYPTRFNGAVEVTTPTMNGLTARVLLVPQNDKSATGTKNNAGVTDLGLAYSNGPLNVAFSSQTLKAGVNALDTTVTQYNFNAVSPLIGQDQGAGQTNSKLAQNTLGANYALGAATLYGAYWTTKESFDNAGVGTVTAKRAGTMVGVKFAVSSAVDLMASYSQVDDKLASVDATIFGLGADYKLSKRTAVYARFQDLDTNKSGLTNAGTGKVTAVGVRHTF